MDSYTHNARHTVLVSTAAEWVRSAEIHNVNNVFLVREQCYGVTLQQNTGAQWGEYFNACNVAFDLSL